LMELIFNNKYLNMINSHEKLKFADLKLCMNCNDWYNKYD
jgi:hypothetical protein